jgi:16S rRNA (guanine1207-N2)-methyltransferase
VSAAPTACVYGAPLPELAEVPKGAAQVSPLSPGSARLEEFEPETLDRAVIAAPPGTVERRYALALALRALKPGASFVAMAPKEKGGSRLGKELKAFGCEVIETGRRHQRLCETRRPEAPEGVEEAIAAGGPRFVEALDLWSQPGLFSWDRPDPGTLLLIQALGAAKLSGRGVDLGCGPGLLARAILAHKGVARLDLVDIDRRAIDAARRNFDDPRVGLHWADARGPLPLEALDFVVMNPPFHDEGAEDKGLGQGFIRQSHKLLAKGGVAWVVANRHLPYEGVLTPLFSRVEVRAEGPGYKVFEARK